ncbi:MAG: transglycosylase SLT domain-containing protein [Saprospiraceae bacterium]|nr:transglycosylase SLT domain-containing protein [Saprospiraceae bacterium]
MPSTAKLRGLRVDDKVDQRLDPVHSTIAAIDYLKTLYGLFGDWALVLAAYNCGENKVLDLIEKTGSKDFGPSEKICPVRHNCLFQHLLVLVI